MRSAERLRERVADDLRLSVVKAEDRFRDRLADIAAPTLMAAGDRDPFCTPDCPVFRIQYALWHLRSELELLERELSDLLDLPEE